MRSVLNATGPALLLLCGLGGAPAAAADADLKITVTNGNRAGGGAAYHLASFDPRPSSGLR